MSALDLAVAIQRSMDGERPRRTYPTARTRAEAPRGYWSEEGSPEERLAALPLDYRPHDYTIFLDARDLSDEALLALLPVDQVAACAELRVAIVDGEVVDASQACPVCRGEGAGDVRTSDEGTVRLECSYCEGEGRVLREAA